ncbi:MAG: hypothetical protein M1818_002451 [Claussenomyces sp. TS43310]|nr:MAG: hypothetical protein M1818_002451 [Claussenomyces sp. TS43310]
MAALTTGDATPSDPQFSDDESLTDEQIQTLLRRAESRLRQSESSLSEPPQASSSLSTSLPKLNVGSLQPSIDLAKGVARVDPSYLRKQQDHGLAGQVRTVEPESVRKQRLKQEKQATAGPNWFNLPQTNLTPELKRDLQLLRLRSVLDPKRHYKKEDTRAAPPAFSQVGTVIESPAEYFSARLPNKQRKRTFADEVLAVEAGNNRFKSAYAKVQADKTSGKKAYYKARMAKRSKRS